MDVREDLHQREHCGSPLITFFPFLYLNCPFGHRYKPIPDSDFWETVFRPIYESNGAYQENIGSHNLSVLCMALAIGTLLDLEKPAHNAEATSYFELARAALALDSVMDEQSIPGIQALVSQFFSVA